MVGVEGPELDGVDDAVHHPRHVDHPQHPGVDSVGLVGAPTVGAGPAAAAAAGERCRRTCARRCPPWRTCSGVIFGFYQKGIIFFLTDGVRGPARTPRALPLAPPSPTTTAPSCSSFDRRAVPRGYRAPLPARRRDHASGPFFPLHPWPYAHPVARAPPPIR